MLKIKRFKELVALFFTYLKDPKSVLFDYKTLSNDVMIKKIMEKMGMMM